MKLSTKPLYAVLWNDAHACATGEFTQDEIDSGEPYQFTTYGLLVRADDKMVVIAAEEAEDGRYRGLSYIPRGMVAEMKDLGAPSAKRTRKARKAKDAE